MQKYSRYRCIEQLAPPLPAGTYCCPYRPPLFDETGKPYERREAVPESVRLRTQLCTPYVRPGYSSSKCIPGGSEGNTTQTAQAQAQALGTPGTEAPVPVRTFSAGEYVQLLGAQVLNAASNAANPDARFQQYFPETIPAPLSVVCPERVPNPATVRDRGCVAQTLFAPSVEGGPIA